MEWKRIKARKKSWTWKWFLIRYNDITSDYCCFITFSEGRKQWLGMDKKLKEAKDICYRHYETITKNQTEKEDVE